MAAVRRSLVCLTLTAAALVPPRALPAAGCAPTEAATAGPFHVPDAPFRTRLAAPGEPGRRLVVEGRVLAAPSCVPVAGAVLDVWQTDDSGRYSREDAGEAHPGDVFRLRGRVRTDAEGRYRFESVLPGHYGGRARHIHLAVEASGHARLTTQLYFAGDPYLESDPLVEPSLVRPLEPLPQGGDRVGFDLVLRAEPR